MNSAITITYGDQAENHKGMQILGVSKNIGLNLEDLEEIKKHFEGHGLICELIDLTDVVKDYKHDEAKVLLIRKCVDFILSDEKKIAKDFYDEQNKLDHDKKAQMYGRVVNKKARHNLCFDNEAQEPKYEEGKGRIVSFASVPITNKIKKYFESLTNKLDNLVAEGNYYYDINECGIGFHGDTERKIVIGVRLGLSIPLEYQWFYKNQDIGQRINIKLDHGDVYIMSEKAVGYDWKQSKILTLRHAAGAAKFLKI